MIPFPEYYIRRRTSLLFLVYEYIHISRQIDSLGTNTKILNPPKEQYNEEFEICQGPIHNIQYNA